MMPSISSLLPGGYNIPNTAKCWTSLTALALAETLPVEIPEHKVRKLDYFVSNRLQNNSISIVRNI